MIIDQNSKAALYLQIYEYFKEKIVSGHFKSGDRLPSKRNLADKLGLSLNTISKAYYLLEEEGFILAVERSGYFVEQLNNFYPSSYQEDKVEVEKEREETKEILYDFSPYSIDEEKFPYYTFSKIFKEVIDSGAKDVISQSDPLGKWNFRMAISKYLNDSRSLNVKAENIVISSGMEYLYEMLFYIFSKDSVFAVENPGYDILPEMILSRGFSCKPIKVEGDGVSLENLKNSGANILTITPSHQFPTGSIMPISKRLDLLKWASSKDNRYIIEDDYDTEFRYVGRPIDPIKKLDAKDRVIYMGSFSKSLAPSMRVSYMILPDKLMEDLRVNFPFFICPVPAINQLVMTKFLEEGYFQRHLNRMRRNYKKKREALIEKLKAYPQVLDISGADSGIHIVVEVKTKKDDFEIESLCKKSGIEIYPLAAYYSKNSKEKSSGKFLFGFGNLNTASLNKGLDEFFKVL
ncbi:PLP-dependent aminotransferase family protein [Neofamilia massiliensis]|uniref:MocR-like pyridoxine biosynthesis transcription factor PdxR n=1 Tax=Neofamilia massiliensis TaxID=1673724 RepID=UPI0006BB99A7|nr:PLP-dependent aminotransferase family protein [Neofamilia massiliensis]